MKSLMMPFQRVVLSCSAVTTVIGILGLLGWTTKFRILASLSLYYIPMAPLTAGGFVLLGSVLFLYAWMPPRRSLSVLGTALVFFVLVTALLKLAEFFTAAHFGFEELIIRHPAAFGAVPTARVALLTATYFFLSAGALLTLRPHRMAGIAAALAFTVMLADSVVLLGYLYGTPLLYGGTIIPMAFTTALGFLFLSIGILAAAGPDYFPLRPLVRGSTRALLLRSFLPVSVVAIVMDGLLHHLLPSGWNPTLFSALSGSIAALIVIGVVSKVSMKVGSEIDRAETHLELELHRLSSLRAIDIAITTSHDLQTILNVLLEMATSQLKVHAASVLLVNTQTQILEFAAGRGLRFDGPPGGSYPRGDFVSDRVALERRMIHIPNFHQAPPQFQCSPLLMDQGFVTYYGMPLIAKGQLKGVLEIFHRTSITADAEWLDFLEALAGQAAIAIDNAHLFENLQRANADLIQAYDTTLEGWSRALDLRDKGTEGHSVRVTHITLRLARAMGITEAELVHIRRGALLHDIGKMGIPDNILLKPGPLTDDERAIMNHHPEYAYQMLSPIAFLRPALDIPYGHHEQWDGNGYPRGLRGDQIPMAVRIFSVVDIWDALISERPYHPPWPKEKIRDHLRSLSGKQLDPKVVEMFLRMEIQGEFEEPGHNAMAV